MLNKKLSSMAYEYIILQARGAVKSSIMIWDKILNVDLLNISSSHANTKDALTRP